MSKDIILKVSHNDIKIANLHIGKFMRGKNPPNEPLLKDMTNLSVNLKNKNIYIIIEGEEVYIKYLKLPNVNSKHKVNSIIKNELIFLYGKKSEDIFYTYTVLKDKDKELGVLVFCLYCSKLSNLEQFINNNKIKRINLIQFCFLSCFQSCINDKDYLFMFEYNKILYILGIFEGRLIANKILDITEGIEHLFMDGLKYILDKMESYNAEPKRIYSVNLKNEDFIKSINELNRYSYIDLGNLNNDEVIKKFTIKKRKYV